MNASASTAMPRPAPGAGRAAGGLSGHRLIIARVAWVAMTLTTLGVAVIAFSTLLQQGTGGMARDQGLLIVSPEILETLQVLGLSEPFIVTSFLSARVAGMLVFALTGAVIFLLRSDGRVTLLVSLMLITLGAALFAPFALLAEVQPQLAPLARFVGVMAPPWPELVRSVGGLSLLLTAFLLPDGRFIPRWARFLAVALVVHVVVWLAFPGSLLSPSRWPNGLGVAWSLGLGAVALGAQFYRFLFVSDDVEKRKTRLVVLSLSAAVAALLLLAVFNPELGTGIYDLVVVTPEMAALYDLLLLLVLGGALALFPISIAVSALRYQLWDIHLLVNRALVYGGLTALVALVYLGGVVLVGGFLGRFVDGVLSTELALVGSTVLVTLTFQPARRAVQAVVDRNFYRRKYDAARTIEAFGMQLRHEVDLNNLADDLLTTVRRTMQPAHVSLWRSSSGEDGGPQSMGPEGGNGAPLNIRGSRGSEPR